ncbi:MAG: CARDB domain-containing protein [Pseudomonadota bacterium]
MAQRVGDGRLFGAVGYAFGITLAVFAWCLFPPMNHAYGFTAEQIEIFGNIAVLEVEGNYDSVLPDKTTNEAPRRMIAKKFYETHPDVYDFLIIFSQFDFQMPPDALAFYNGVKNDVKGIGKEIFDNSIFYGSDGKLQGTIDMGNLSNMVSDPLDPGFSSTMGTMSHELMHRWAAFVKFRGIDGNASPGLLGKEGDHWSFLLDTDGSLMYGNRWRDNGDGTYTTLPGKNHYSPLDLYLAGFIGKTEVPPMLLIDSMDVDPQELPKPDVTIEGLSRYITIDDIVAAEGERIPHAGVSQKSFKIAVIYIARPGTCKREDLYKIKNLVQKWELWFSALTDGRAAVSSVGPLLEDFPENPGGGTPVADPRDAPPEIQDGITWLMTHQVEDGKWMDVPLTTVRDTAEAVSALGQFPVAGQNVSHGLQWLASDLVSSTDAIARKLRTMSKAGAEMAPLLSGLIDRRNADGGWGSDRYYVSNPIDTALVLSALAVCEYSDNTVTGSAIEYLQENQNGDGGWGYSEGESDIQTSATVLSAFSRYKEKYVINEHIQKGFSWLLGKQNMDGGFGNSPSTVYDTALALQALKNFSAAFEVSAGLNYLLNLQSRNGSWYESPYQTAMAISTLWASLGEADLVVSTSDIGLSPETIEMIPSNVAVTARISNLGLTDVAAVAVVLYDGAITENGKIGEQVVAVNGASFTNVLFDVTVSDGNSHQFYVVVDPKGEVSEAGTSNNTALRIIYPESSRDFVITPSDFIVSTQHAVMLETITTGVSVRNRGTSAAQGVAVKFSVESSGKEYPISFASLDIPAGGVVAHEFVWKADRSGEDLRLKVQVDPEDTIFELSETNNWAVLPIIVDPATQEADLAVTTSDIIFTPAKITGLPTPLSVEASVSNLGLTGVPQVTVALYHGEITDAGKVGEQIVSVAAQSITPVIFNVTVSEGGAHRFYLSIDPQNLVAEASESNNTALRMIYPEDTLDFEIISSGFTATPQTANVLETVVVSVPVGNNGTDDAYNVPVRLRIDTLEGSFPIATSKLDIPAGTTAVAEFHWEANKTGQSLFLTAQVDPDDDFPELSETNNTASLPIAVNAFGKPNLSLSHQNISFSGEPANQGDSVDISAVVFNNGYSDVGNAKVVFYDGPPENGGALIGTRVIALLKAGESVPITCTWNGISVFGERIVFIRIDPDAEISEIDEEDNSAFRTLKILSLPDLAVATASIAFAPVAPRVGDPVMIRVAVQNNGDQAAATVPVQVREGGTIIDSGVIETISPKSYADISFRFDPAGRSGSFNITVVVDPENIIGETDKSNNIATRSLGVQNSNLWLSERFVSPNGDGVQDETRFFFTLATQQTVKVVVTDASETVVRSFRGSDLENITTGSVAWNGLNDNGMVVPDGAYQLSVMDSAGNVLAALVVTVDNNKSPLAEAIGTQYWMITGEIPILKLRVEYYFWFLKHWQWFPDDSGMIGYLAEPDPELPQFPTGIYTVTPSGDQVTRIVPWEWSENNDPVYYYYYEYWGGYAGTKQYGFSLSPNGRQVAFLLAKYNKLTKKVEQRQLWVTDRYGESRTLIGGSGIEGDENFDITDVFWAPDSTSIAYKRYNRDNGQCQFVMQRIGVPGKVVIPTGSVSNMYLQIPTWSPDSSRLIYISDSHVSSVDWNGNTETLLPVGSPYVFIDWLTDKKVLARVCHPGLSPVYDIWIIDITDKLKNLNVDNNIPVISYQYNLPKYQYWETEFLYGDIVLPIVEPIYMTDISPKGHHFTYRKKAEDEIPGPNGDSWDFVTLVCDENGTCRPAHQIGSPDQFLWNPDGTKLLIPDEYHGVVSIHDVVSKKTDVFQIGKPACWETLLYPPMAYDYPDYYTIHPMPENLCDGNVRLSFWSQGLELEGGGKQWLDTNRIIGQEVDSHDWVAFDVRDATWKRLPMEFDMPILSPLKKYIANQETRYYSYMDPYQSVKGVLGSLLNLSVSLQLIQDESAIKIAGTAADLNFSHYVLEYADSEAPDGWHPIMPPSELQVFDDTFSFWVPPHEGTFHVRLTVWDRAGNSTWTRKRIAWGKSAQALVNLYKEGDFLSPNEDGVADNVKLHFTVTEPVHLEMKVLDDSGTVIRKIERDYAIPGDFAISWEGADENGFAVSDGSYTLKIQDFEFTVIVDNTPPVTSLTMGGIVANGNLCADLSGLAVDDNLKYWRIEYGEGNNPGEWHEYQSGENPLRKVSEANVPVPDSDGNPLPTRVASFKNEHLTFAANKRFRIVAEDDGGNTSVSTADFLEEIFVVNKIDNLQVGLEPGEEGAFKSTGALAAFKISENHAISVLETLRVPIQKLVFQYRMNMQWYDSEAIPGEDEGAVVLDWDGSTVDPAAYAIRVKAVDFAGETHYSNIVGNKEAKIRLSLCPDSENGIPEGKGLATLEIQEDLASIKIQVMSSSDGNYRDWTDYEIFTFPAASFLFSQPTFLTKGMIRLVGIGMRGKEYISESAFYPPRGCEGAAGETEWPDGNCAGPVAEIKSPQNGEISCPRIIADPEGDWYGVVIGGEISDTCRVKRFELLYGVGEAPSDWEYAKTRVDCAPGQLPYNMGGRGGRSGMIGIWDVTELGDGKYTVKLNVEDDAGNISEFTSIVILEPEGPPLAASMDTDVISPNNDGYSDNVEIRLTAGTRWGGRIDSEAVFQVLKYEENAWPDPFVPVITYQAGTVYAGVEKPIIWDGKDEHGQVVPDGKYKIVVSAGEYCKTNMPLWVNVDNTPPEIAITYPQQGIPVGMIFGINGRATDLNFESYRLTAKEENQTSGSEILIAESDHPLEEVNQIATWNTYGLDGRWKITLTATDKPGNKSDTSVVVDLAQQEALVVLLKATPELFSPNNDGKLERTEISYELVDNAAEILTISDHNGNIVKTFGPTGTLSGIKTVYWDGLNDDGRLVPDGRYEVSLTADRGTIRKESVWIVVDTTPPSVQVITPADQSFVKEKDLTVKGTVYDGYPDSYTLSVVGDTGLIGDKSETRNRDAYDLWTLSGLKDGIYTLGIMAKDRGENVTEFHAMFTLDTTPPEVSMVSPGIGEIYGGSQPSVPVKAEILETNLSSWALRYGKGNQPEAWTEIESDIILPPDHVFGVLGVGASSGIADGEYTLSLAAVDKAGWVTDARMPLTVDNTPPVIEVTSLPQGDGYIREPVDLLGKATDAHLKYYRVELAQGGCGQEMNWSVVRFSPEPSPDGVLAPLRNLVTDGRYCVRVSAGDAAGNVSSSIFGFTLDTRPPASPALNGEKTGEEAFRLFWERNDEPDLAGYHLYRDGRKLNANPIPGAEYADTGIIEEGVYTYTLTAVDFAGGESAPSNPVRFIKDRSGPEARIVFPRDGALIGDFTDIVGTAYSADDFKEYRLYVGRRQGVLEPENWALLRTSPVTVRNETMIRWDLLGIAEGDWIIKLEALDLNGNRNTDRVSVRIDNTPPAAPVLLSATVDGDSVTLVWRANSEPDLSGYLLYRNHRLANAAVSLVTNLKPFLITATTHQDIGVPDGISSYYVEAMDTAGNISDPSNSLDITIDTHAPSVSIVVPENNKRFDGSLLIKGESPDEDIAGVQFQYKAAGNSEWKDLGTPVTQKPYMVYLDPTSERLNFGDYRLRAVATDRSLKTDPAPPEITVVYRDATAPPAPKDLCAHVNGGDITLIWTAGSETDLAGYNIYRVSDGLRDRRNAAPVTDPSFAIQPATDGEYTFDVTAVDLDGNESLPSSRATALVYTPEIAPRYNLTTDTDVMITGNAAAGAEVEVFNETGSARVSLGTSIADAMGDFAFEAALPSLENHFSVIATDTAGNVSKQSETILVISNTPPAAPTGFTSSGATTLVWDPNTEEDLFGYNLYRDGEKVNAAVDLTTGICTGLPNNYHAGEAFDGNTLTFDYMVISGNEPQWWQVEFPEYALIRRVEIDWYRENPSPAADFEIQAWTGYTWHTLLKVEGNESLRNVVELDVPYGTQKIRVYMTSAYSGYGDIRLAEVLIKKENVIPSASHETFQALDGEAFYQVSAVDRYGLESPLAGEPPPDRPVGLTAMANGENAVLTWAPETDSTIAGYRVFKETVQSWIRINPTHIIDQTYTDASVVSGDYRYRITVVRRTGSQSAPSEEAPVEIVLQPSTEPIELAITKVPEGGALTICWESWANDTVGYNLYRSASKEGRYEKINTGPITGNCFSDRGLGNGVSYDYLLGAINSIGVQSICSNPASAYPDDTIAPAPPVLVFPAKSAVPVHLNTSLTDITGFSEEGASVTLHHGDEEMETTIASGDTVTALPNLVVEMGAEDFAISPDGKTLVYSLYNPYGKEAAFWTRDVNTGACERIFTGDTGAFRWSPDGGKIVYPDHSDSGRRLKIHDMETKSTLQITGEDGFDDEYPNWSSDGKQIVFTRKSMYSTSGYSLWRYDAEAKTAQKLLEEEYLASPDVSPDGRKIAYHDRHLARYVDLDTGEIVTVDENFHDADSLKTLQWSPAGNEIAFVSERSGTPQLFVMDTNTGRVVQLTGYFGTIEEIQWSPDGSEIACIGSVADRHEVFVIPSNGSAPGRVFPQVGGTHPVCFDWTATGELFVISIEDSFVITLRGFFKFADVPLNIGENRFDATAVDTAGNAGGPSEPISVILNRSELADLEVRSRDIFVFPSTPLEGEETKITAFFRNKGAGAAKNVHLNIYVQDSSGKRELIHKERFETVAPYSEASVPVEWLSRGRAGENIVMVEIYAEDDVLEVSGENNSAAKAFFVSRDQGIDLIAGIDKDNFDADENVEVNIRLYNSGLEKLVSFKAWIEDEQGAIVAVLQDIHELVPYGVTRDYSKTWNTGTTYAGNYLLKVRATDPTGGIQEKVIPFAVKPDIRVSASVITDRVRFDPNERVTVDVNLASNGKNFILPYLDLKISIVDEHDTAWLAEERRVDQLIPGARITLSTGWNTGLSTPGNYRATVEAYWNGEKTAGAEAAFVINAASVISGTLALPVTSVIAGEPVVVDYTIGNSGNTDVADLPIEVLVVDPETLTTVSAKEIILSLGMNETSGGQVVFNTLDYAPKRYTVLLKRTGDGEATVIDRAEMVVEEDSDPVVIPDGSLRGTLSAVPGIVQSGEPVTFHYTLSNESGVDIFDLFLEVAAVGPAWFDMQATTDLPAGGMIAGEFEVSTTVMSPSRYDAVLNVKLAGMTAMKTLAGASFVVGMPLHPPTADAGGPYIAAVGEAIEVDGSGSFDVDAGESESGLPPFDMIKAFGWEKRMVAPLDFDDAAGEKVALPGYDQPGGYDIALRVTDNTAAAFPGSGLPDQTDVSESRIEVFQKGFGDLAARAKSTKVQITWSALGGAASYEVLRSEDGPNTGFTVIGVTTSTYSGYIDTPIVLKKKYWYRIQTKIDGLTVISKAIYVCSEERTQR